MKLKISFAVIALATLALVVEPLVEAVASDIKIGVVNADGKHPNMVYIPAGEFIMGSDETYRDEKPAHKVFLEGFWMDIYEVTNHQYEKFDPDFVRSRFSPADNGPAINVTWEQALAFCQAHGKRFPSEQEWERAAKGPESYKYAYGNEYDNSKAQTGKRKAAPVGTYSPNGYGLFDMTGNAWEWTSSVYGPYPGAKGNFKNPARDNVYTVRGGGHDSHSGNTMTTKRRVARSDNVGFRCVSSE